MTIEKADGDDTRVRDPPVDGAVAPRPEVVADVTSRHSPAFIADDSTSGEHEFAADSTRLRGHGLIGDETLLRDPAPPADATWSRNAAQETGFTAASAVVSSTKQAIPFGQGYTLRGRYVLDELIGYGAMGQICLVRRRKTVIRMLPSKC
jgi:hypothetical protein